MTRFATAVRCILVLVCLCTTSLVQAQVKEGNLRVRASDELVKITGRWFFRAGDKPEYSRFDYDASGWKMAPSNGWNYLPEFANFWGTGWYRLNIRIDEKKTYALFVPLHMRGARFYWNGVLVRESRAFSSGGTTPRIYGKPELLMLPRGLIKTGRNTLAIRMGATDNFTGFEDSFFLGTVNRIQSKWVRHILYYGTLAFISLFLAGYFFLHYLERRKERYYLYFAGTNLMLGTWILGFQGLSLYIIDQYWFYVLTTYPSGLLISFFAIDFVHLFFDMRKRWPGYALQTVYAVFSIFVVGELLLTGHIALFNRYLFPYMLGSMALIAIYLITTNIIAIRRKRPFAIRSFVGMFLYGATLVFSMLVFANVLPYEPLLNEGFFILVVVFATVLARRFSNVHQNLEIAHVELQDLNLNLENRVQERTASLREAQSRIVQLEKESTERQMAGGFAHEIRNALSGTRLLLEQALGRDRPDFDYRESLNLSSSRLLKEMFHYLKDTLKPEELENCLRLMKRVFDNEQRMENIAEISYQSVVRGLAITREIMDYSVIGQEQAKRDAVNVSSMLAELARNYTEEFRGEKIRIEVEIPRGDRALVLEGHEPHFHSAISNIILNARDAIREKDFTGGEERIIHIHGEHLKESIQLRISDNGVGMDAGHQEKIYDAFFTTRPQTGIGLGMGIVRKIVSLYDGHIKVESEPGQGTTFTLSFDLQTPAA